MSHFKSALDTTLFCLAVLLCAAWLTTAKAAAICSDGCDVPSSCVGQVEIDSWSFEGCVGGAGCYGDNPCCCGYICWWKDSAGICGNDDWEGCLGASECSV